MYAIGNTVLLRDNTEGKILAVPNQECGAYKISLLSDPARFRLVRREEIRRKCSSYVVRCPKCKKVLFEYEKRSESVVSTKCRQCSKNAGEPCIVATKLDGSQGRVEFFHRS